MEREMIDGSQIPHMNFFDINRHPPNRRI
jgi:hypothetical protein